MSLATVEKTKVVGKRQATPERKAKARRPAGTPYRGGAVFSINFVRSDMVPMRFRRIMLYSILGYLAVNVAVLFGLMRMASNTQDEWQALQAALNGELTSATAVNALTQEMDRMNAQATRDVEQLDRVIALKREEFFVGGKLASLARTIPIRTWITDISGDRDGRRITIQAAYLIDPEAPYDLPTKAWIDALRADPDFGDGLKQIVLGESSQKMQGSAELFSFDLIVEWER